MADSTKEFFSELKSEFKDLGAKVNHIFDDLVKGKSKGEIQVRADVFQNATEFIWELDLPGFDKALVKAQLRDENLVVSGSRTRPDSGTDIKFFNEERKFGSFERLFQIPEGADQSRIQAKFENGILRITMPRTSTGSEKQNISID
jgi:HSP20 family protein